MPSDLTIPRIGAAAAAVDVTRSRTGVPADKATADGTTGQQPAAGKALPNPTLRLDPGLAIVVIEFRDEVGAVRSSIPTEQQLEAYRSWHRGHIGAPPAPTPPPVKDSATDTRG